MNKIIESIREELQRNADEETRVSGQRFFKEETKTYGVKTATVTRLGKQYFKLIKDREKQDIFDLCEELWQSGYMEESFIACHWSYYIRKQYQPDDFAVFEKWGGPVCHQLGLL
jgi:3-methyladenine DNA glycosylase AlkD